jgi:hypothetical protein
MHTFETLVPKCAETKRKSVMPVTSGKSEVKEILRSKFQVLNSDAKYVILWDKGVQSRLLRLPFVKYNYLVQQILI